ncbi:hypothetical protein [Crossiella sp. CA198]|uniref:hypothetical protein n=1 Tax=Crossiella sp. CA198 TaxID=3455607 RepID=UPI003F8D6BAB
MNQSPTPAARRRIWSWIAAGVLFAALLPALPASATSTPAPPVSCTEEERAADLVRERDRVLPALEQVRTVRNWAQLGLLAATGWGALGHGFVSFKGAGVAIARTDSPLSGSHVVIPLPVGSKPLLPLTMPDLVFYAPNPESGTVTHPHSPDFPYTLVGWGYWDLYNLERHPTGRGPLCLTRRDWHVHERGIHDFATFGFVPVPPRESFQGESSGAELVPPLELLRNPGIVHKRAWNTHLWLTPDGTTVTPAFANPHQPIRGQELRYGEWFFQPPSR